MWFLTVFGLMCSSPAICGVVLAVRDQLQHLDLAVGELGADRRPRLGLRASSRARAAAPSRRCVGEISDSPTAADADAAHQLLDRRVLQQVAAGAGQDRVHHVAVLVGDRQHDDARERRDRRDLPRRLDAAHPRHVQVHDDDVGRELARRAARPRRRSPPRRRPARPAPRAGCAGPSGRGRGRPRAGRAASRLPTRRPRLRHSVSVAALSLAERTVY